MVFRLFPLGLRGRDRLFTAVSWLSGPDSKDLLLIDILSNPLPLTSTATISAGNLRYKSHFSYRINELRIVTCRTTCRANQINPFIVIYAYGLL